jgi:hypothetical protein
LIHLVFSLNTRFLRKAAVVLLISLLLRKNAPC